MIDWKSFEDEMPPEHDGAQILIGEVGELFVGMMWYCADPDEPGWETDSSSPMPMKDILALPSVTDRANRRWALVTPP